MKIITKFNLEDEVYGIAQHRSNGIYINKISIKGRIIRINLERSHEYKRDVYVVHDKHQNSQKVKIREPNSLHTKRFDVDRVFMKTEHAKLECAKLISEGLI